MLKLINLNVGYEKNIVVNDLNATFFEGELVCVIGPNGSGKTTLLKAIANIKNYDGDIIYNEKSMHSLTRKELGKKMAMLSQNSSTYFPFTVYDLVQNARYPYIDGIFSSPKKEDYEIVDKALKEVGMFESKDEKINEISGGQLQRAYLAKLIAQQPEIILLDEPTNHLDLKYQIETIEFIKKITKSENKISIVVLHDLNLVNRYADKVIMLSEKDEYICGTPKEVLSRENISNYYHIDIKNWMKETLELWSD